MNEVFLREVLEGTPLEFVFNALLSGEFTDAKAPVSEDEVVIGEMTYFERAVYTAAAQLQEKCREGACSTKADLDTRDAIMALFKASIGKHFGADRVLHVRAGFRIVERPPKCSDCPTRHLCSQSRQ